MKLGRLNAFHILSVLILLAGPAVRTAADPGTRDDPARPSSSIRHPTVYITPDDIARAKENARRYPWAAKIRGEIIREADSWLARTDEWILAQVPAKGACFAYGFTGCPICGAQWGIWDKARASFDNPGRVTCDNGHVLPNPDYPDNGTGWTGADGRIHYFVGSYNAWVIEKLTLTAAENLAYAYSLTGDERYAEKASLILDAVAAIYPYCDKGSWDYPSNPPSGRLDRPWYQVARVLVHLVDHYDQIFHSPSLDKPSLAPDLSRRRNIEDNMLRNGARYCHEQSREGGLNNGEADYVRGAMAAGICLGIPEYIHWAVDGPFGIHSLLENNIGRDGTYYETSMNYSDHARSLYVTFAEPLINCRREPYPEGLDLYGHPKFRALMSLLNLTFNCAGHRPSFGDTAPDVSKIEAPPAPFDANDFMALARLYSRSREASERKRLEPLLRRLAGDGMDELLEKAPDPVWLLFHADTPPPGDGTLSGELEARLTGSGFLGQKGIGVLRTGTGENAQALLLRFGPSLNHGHFDDLNFNYFAGGREITYDLGYDLASTHTQVGWAKQTISHNLVAVDETSQGTESGGSLHLFADFPGLKLLEASSENSYRSRGVSLYRRLMALVATGETSYLLDVFRVRGGRSHDYSIHFLGRLTGVASAGLGGEMPGSLAGPGIDWGSRQLNDGDMEGRAASPYWNPPPGNGYGFLVKPRPLTAGGSWQADWEIDPERRVRLNVADIPGAEIFKAHAPGIRPRYPGADYIVIRRKGADLSSRFAAVIEPFSAEPAARDIRRLALHGPASDVPAEALAVRLADGSTDIFYSSADDEIRTAGGLAFAGRFIHARVAKDRLLLVHMAGAREFRGFGRHIRVPRSGWEGVVRETDGRNQSLKTDSPLSPEGLEGQVITFDHPRYSRSSSYRIARVEKEDGSRRVLLNETFLLGKGEVSGIKDGRTLVSRIPHEYARAVKRSDSGFFRGKLIQGASGGRTRILGSVPGRLLTLEVEDSSIFKKGEIFSYQDIQPGDQFRIESLVSVEFPESGGHRSAGTAGPEIGDLVK